MKQGFWRGMLAALAIGFAGKLFAVVGVLVVGMLMLALWRWPKPQIITASLLAATLFVVTLILPTPHYGGQQVASNAAQSAADSTVQPHLSTSGPAGAATSTGFNADDGSQESTNSASVQPPRANVISDIRGWQNYATLVVHANIGNITNSPYVYLVPMADDPANAAAVAKVRDQLASVVAATVLPGNMIAAVGPSSATTAQVLESAFRNVVPGSFRGVVVLFIGDRADEPVVRAAVAPSGATFKFAQM